MSHQHPALETFLKAQIPQISAQRSTFSRWWDLEMHVFSYLPRWLQIPYNQLSVARP
jgi:hypothetical protein